MDKEKKIQQTIYPTYDHKEKLEEISLFMKKMGSKQSYSDIVAEGIDQLHIIAASDYFMLYKEEYPRWRKHWAKKTD